MAQRWGLSGCDHYEGGESSVGTKSAEGDWGVGREQVRGIRDLEATKMGTAHFWVGVFNLDLKDKLEELTERRNGGGENGAGEALGASVAWRKEWLDRRQRSDPLACWGLRGVPRGTSGRARAGRGPGLTAPRGLP